jgi:hypothetical protein
VSGIGIAADIEVSAATLKFGEVPVGESSEGQSVLVSNPGEADLDVTVVAPDSGEFEIEDGCSSRAIGPGENCTIAALFSPTASGVQSEGIIIKHNAEGRAVTVTLEGNGVAPAIAVSPLALTFEDRAVYTTSEVMTVTIRNGGTAPLDTTVTLGGPDLNEFAIRSNECSNTSLAPGVDCSITVDFQPSSSRTFNASLAIDHNADAPPITVALRGTGFIEVD